MALCLLALHYILAQFENSLVVTIQRGKITLELPLPVVCLQVPRSHFKVLSNKINTPSQYLWAGYLGGHTRQVWFIFYVAFTLFPAAWATEKVQKHLESGRQRWRESKIILIIITTVQSTLNGAPPQSRRVCCNTCVHQIRGCTTSN